MKMFYRALLMLLPLATIISLSGCGGESGPTSMTDGVPLSEIEAYEQSVLEMEAEDTGDMDADDSARE